MLKSLFLISLLIGTSTQASTLPTLKEVQQNCAFRAVDLVMSTHLSPSYETKTQKLAGPVLSLKDFATTGVKLKGIKFSQITSSGYKNYYYAYVDMADKRGVLTYQVELFAYRSEKHGVYCNTLQYAGTDRDVPPYLVKINGRKLK